MIKEQLQIGDIVEVLYTNVTDIEQGVKFGDTFIVLENSRVPFCFNIEHKITNFYSDKCVALMSKQVNVIGHDHK